MPRTKPRTRIEIRLSVAEGAASPSAASMCEPQEGLGPGCQSERVWMGASAAGARINYVCEVYFSERRDNVSVDGMTKLAKRWSALGELPCTTVRNSNQFT
jgi:hypothetical protein